MCESGSGLDPHGQLLHSGINRVSVTLVNPNSEYNKSDRYNRTQQQSRKLKRKTKHA